MCAALPRRELDVFQLVPASCGGHCGLSGTAQVPCLCPHRPQSLQFTKLISAQLANDQVPMETFLVGKCSPSNPPRWRKDGISVAVTHMIDTHLLFQNTCACRGKSDGGEGTLDSHKRKDADINLVEKQLWNHQNQVWVLS